MHARPGTAAVTSTFGNALGQALASNGAGQQQETQLSPWLNDMIARAVYTNTVTDVPLGSGGPQLTGNGVQYSAFDVAYGINDDNPYDQIIHNGAGEEITAQDRWNEARNRADSAVTAKYQEHYKRLEDAEAIARVNAQRAQESSAQNQRELNRTASLVEMNAQARADSGSVAWGANPRVGGGSSITAENAYTPAKSLIGDSYRTAVNGMLDPSNTPLQRLVFGGLAAATAIPGFANDLAADAYNAPGNVYTGAQRVTIGLATGDTTQLSAGLMQTSGGILGFTGILGATQSIVANEIALAKSQMISAEARGTYNVTNSGEKTVTLYRVDDAAFTPRILADGSVPVVTTGAGGERALFVNIGQPLRAQEFALVNRSGNATVTAVDVDASLLEKLRSTAVYDRSAAARLNPTAPLKVDIKTPDQFGLRTPEQIQWLREAIKPSTVRIVDPKGLR